MDKAFSYFLTNRGFGPAENTQQVPLEKIKRYRDKLPDLLLNYWELYGWSSYGKGLFWLVDPEAYEPVLNVCLQGTPFIQQDSYYVIARSAFGKLFLWGIRSGQSLKIEIPFGEIYPMDGSNAVREGKSDILVQSFFMTLKRERLDMEDVQQRPLFERALTGLGPLSEGEMYGFEPALALGGKAEMKYLRKLEAIPHLIILGQLGERKVMRDVVKDARDIGLVK